jgi:hypothetical protein
LVLSPCFLEIEEISIYRVQTWEVIKDEVKVDSCIIFDDVFQDRGDHLSVGVDACLAKLPQNLFRVAMIALFNPVNDELKHALIEAGHQTVMGNTMIMGPS